MRTDTPSRPLDSRIAETYERLGYALLDDVFLPRELLLVDAAIDKLIERGVEGLVFEDDGVTPRAMHGMHLFSEVFERLARDPRLLGTAQSILGGDVYLHQYKLNFKRAMAGDLWPWHQDYVFWEQEDGLRAPRLVNLCVFLDEVHEFNRPLCFIPGSHAGGVAETNVASDVDGGAGETGDDWERNFSRRLTYTVGQEQLEPLMRSNGIEAPKGPAGSILLFHPNAVHGSAPNISATDRRLLILTYNRTDNLPVPVAKPRPEFLVGRDYRPLSLWTGRELGDTA